jgi:hypothetical protein
MRQLMDRQVPAQRPTPTVAPEIQWVVETGSAKRVAITTVMAEPNSMENPHDGECSVMRLPQLAHHVVAVEGETEGNACAAEDENPDGDGGLGGDLSGGPDEVDGCQGTGGAIIVSVIAREKGERGGTYLATSLAPWE